ncbi:MAG: tRNA pseudouridine(55) synthase TruB [bacterium]
MNGILIVDKPGGWTSQDVCAKLRGLYAERRIGHGGTLDPMATGVLPVYLGKATKAAFFSENSEKEYLAGVQWGIETDTQDTTGRTLRETGLTPSREDVLAALPKFTGALRQVPPMYSAVKIGGKKLYELARSGVEVERKPREITIYSLSLTEAGLLRVRCSKGTYIRTLVHELGQALGCGAAMSSLRRLEAGGFTIGESVPLETLLAAAPAERQRFLLPMDAPFLRYPALTVRGRQEKLARCGNPFPAPLPDGRCRVYAENGDFLLLGNAVGGTVTVERSFL